MSLDAEVRDLERRMLTGDATALSALRRAWERQTVPLVVHLSSKSPEAASPCKCLTTATEADIWLISADRWELCTVADTAVGWCCSFLPPEREGEPYHSEDEARAAAAAWTAARRAAS